MKIHQLILFVFLSSILIAQPVKNFQPERKSLKSYNLKGDIVKVETYFSFDNLKTKSLKNTYIFNDAGYLVYIINNKNDTTHRYFYDDKNNLIRFRHVEDIDNLTYNYQVDDKGNICKINTKAQLWYKNMLGNGNDYWQFDDKGNVIERHHIGGAVEYFSYDENNMLIKEENEDYSNSYVYNDKNDIIKTIFDDGLGEDVFENKYEYDKIGNWIKRTSNNIIELRNIFYKKDIPAAKSSKKKK